MSNPAFMIDCNYPTCSSGYVKLSFVDYKGYKKFVTDFCPKCGGSGRIVASFLDIKMKQRQWHNLQKLSKKQKVEMREWIEFEKQLIYGVKE